MSGWEEITGSANILIIDDDPMAIKLLRGMLTRGSYRNIWTTDDPESAVELFGAVQPDLVLTDLHMSPIDGLEVLGRLQAEIPPEAYLPILVVTGDVSEQAKLRALLLGAKDFITKPIDLVETMLRIRIHLETRFRFLEMQRTIERLRRHDGEEGSRA